MDAETKIKMAITIIIVLSNERDKSAEEKLNVSTSLIEGRGVTKRTDYLHRWSYWRRGSERKRPELRGLFVLKKRRKSDDSSF